MSILVTGIGGMVGQGVLKNIRRSYNTRFALIGTDIDKLTNGNYLCDKTYKVPLAVSDDYTPEIRKICFSQDVQLIIPSTDYEMYHLMKNKTWFEACIAGSPTEVSLIGLDKYKTYQEFARYDIPFAKSCLPSEYKDQFKDCIIKPREGRGSRDIHVKANPYEFDDTYIVQELLSGDELTIAFYVKKNGELHGFIVFRRILFNGYTNVAEVVFEYNDQVYKLIERMIYHFPFRGSINIQAKVHQGEITPFELNCRVSGTNSIRSRFGFQDVKYMVQEYLLNEDPSPVHITKGSALRIINDLIYPEINLNEINHESEHYIF